MKVSIVTLSYNQASFLERALRSVLTQSHSEIEYIVIDPGSTDGSREIIESYRPHIAKIIFERDSGPADGLQRGLRESTGSIFGYINADDRLLPGAINKIVETFTTHPESDIVLGHGYIEDHRHGVTRRFRVSPPPFTPWTMAFDGVSFLQQGMFLRTDVVRAVGGFNIDNRTCWDAELLAELVLHGARFRRIDAMLAVFTLHNASISGSQRLQATFHRDWKRIRERLLGRELHREEPLNLIGARLAKWIADPKTLLWRLESTINPSRRIREEADATPGPPIPLRSAVEQGQAR